MAVPSPAVATAGEESHGRTAFEVADVVRAYGASFLSTHPTSGAQRRVLRAIATVPHRALGGHVEGCDACGHTRIAYNSCRNRHCPKCQGAARAKWMAAEQAMLLPVEYFHVVFTLPHALNPLIRVNPRELYGLLFRAAAATLLAFARDPKHLGGEPAITMVLHTWGQNLTEHAHVHCVVSGGGLSADARSWQSTKRHGFLFPVKALSKMFRGKYLAALDRLQRTGALRFTGQSARLSEASTWLQLLTDLRRTPWVVYAKPPFGGPACVLKYLSRYTHRVAISNRRLLFVGDGVVRFAWKDYADHNADKEMTLQRRGVPAPLPAARRAARLHAHPPLRAPGQSPSRAEAGSLPRTPRRWCSTTISICRFDATDRSARRRRRAPHRVGAGSRARSAASRCVWSRSSPRKGTTRHDSERSSPQCTFASGERTACGARGACAARRFPHPSSQQPCLRSSHAAPTTSSLPRDCRAPTPACSLPRALPLG